MDELEETNSLVTRIVTQTAALANPIKMKNPAAVALGKLGASKGGKARAKNLSPEKRRAIARKAAQTRWTTSK